MMFKPFGKYTILKKIASGGMAEIFLAADLSPTGLARFVVIKRALAQYSDNKEFRDMFKNEGKVACNLKHRNIAPIYEFGIENNQFYLSMEYISGMNLRELIKKLRSLKKPVDIRYAVYIIKEIASGLNYAHNAIESSTGQPLNLIHRDISPQNIMLSFDGEIRIIDFGISKIDDTDLTRVGHLKGKFSYMSPEQARGESIDGRTDIFCLGIIFWELLSGQRLFPAKNEIDALKKIKSCNIPDIKKINPKISNKLAAIVNQSLNKNKNLRTKTAAVLEKELSIFLNKNYPEFSQYDFMSFIKNIYSKEIIQERENLKSSYKDFKNHLSKLSIENDFSIKLESNTLNGRLDIPDIDTPETKTQARNKEGTGTGTGTGTATQQTSDLSNYVSFSKTGPKKSIDDEDPDHSSTFLLKGKNYDATDDITKVSANHSVTKPRENKNSQLLKTNPSQNLKTNTNFDIIKDGKESLMIYSNSTKTKNSKFQSSYKNQTHNNLSAQFKIEKKIDLIKNIAAFVLILSIGFGGFYAFKNKETIIHSKKWDKLFKEKSSSEKSLNAHVEQNTPETKPARDIGNIQVKKVWVQTKPSGATVYINKKAISNTPAILNINLNQVTELTIYKQGYFPYSLQKNQISQLDNSLSVTLQRNKKKRRPKNITIIR